MVIVLCLLALTARAQDDVLEYKMDFGAGLGPCFYMGDANKTPFGGTSIMGAVTARRIFNERMALKANLAVGHLRGVSDGFYIPKDAGSHTPEGGIPVQVDFSRCVMDVGAQFEFNFWGFGMGQSYKGTSRITPYVLAGVGMTLAMGGVGTDVALNIPVGLGVKYKVKPRVNIGLEWTFRFTTTDRLDVSHIDKQQLDQPYNIQTFGFMNKDLYSFLMFFVTYDMCPKLRKCNN
ncbi:MAG: hypothetical protein HUK03_02895 [Bacteroidaceae bacterium]|nr:hypothetical protein [Bacteroidaceae bacterium]